MNIINQSGHLYDKISFDIENLVYSSDNIQVTTSKSSYNKDSRLFPNLLLYCEGAHRPLFRGCIHGFLSIFLPLGWWHLYREANGSIFGQIIGSIYVLTNIICYFSSALYHIGKWSLTTEISLQKVDHCGIALLSTGTMLPAALLLLDYKIGWIWAGLTTALCVWTCYKIMKLQASVLRQILVAASIVPFLPFCYYYMNKIEWYCTISCCIFQSIGAVVFINKNPKLFPDVFGYHELFHFFVGLAGICVYLVNWSIIRRTCNQYSHHTDVSEILWHLLVDPEAQFYSWLSS